MALSSNLNIVKNKLKELTTKVDNLLKGDSEIVSAITTAVVQDPLLISKINAEVENNTNIDALTASVSTLTAQSATDSAALTALTVSVNNLNTQDTPLCKTTYHTYMDYFAKELKSQNAINQSTAGIKSTVDKLLDNWGGHQINWDSKIEIVSAAEVKAEVESGFDSLKSQIEDFRKATSNIYDDIAAKVGFGNYDDAKDELTAPSKPSKVEAAQQVVSIVNTLKSLLAGIGKNAGTLTVEVQNILDNWPGADLLISNDLNGTSYLEIIASSALLTAVKNAVFASSLLRPTADTKAKAATVVETTIIEEAGFLSKAELKVALTDPNYNERALNIIELINLALKLPLEMQSTASVNAAAVNAIIDAWGGFDIIAMDGTTVKKADLVTALKGKVNAVAPEPSTLAGFIPAIIAEYKKQAGLSDIAEKAAYIDYHHLLAYAQNVDGIVTNLTTAINDSDGPSVSDIKAEVDGIIDKWTAPAIMVDNGNISSTSAADILTAVKTDVDTVFSAGNDITTTLKNAAKKAADAIAKKVAFKNYADATDSLSSPDSSIQQKAQQVVSIANGLKLAILESKPVSALEDVNIVFDNIKKTLLNPITALEFSSSQIAYVTVKNDCANDKKCDLKVIGSMILTSDNIDLENKYLKLEVKTGSSPYKLNMNVYDNLNTLKASIEGTIVNINCDYALFNYQFNNSRVDALLAFNDTFDFNINELTFTGVPSPSIDTINQYSQYASLEAITITEL
jgi:hypothetical protein